MTQHRTSSATVRASAHPNPTRPIPCPFPALPSYVWRATAAVLPAIWTLIRETSSKVRERRELNIKMCFAKQDLFSSSNYVIVTVTGATDCGLLEGVLRGQGTGLFPAHCVQEVRLRHTNIPIGPQIVREGRNRVLGRRESQHKYFATAPRLKKPWVSLSQTIFTNILGCLKSNFAFLRENEGQFIHI